MPHSHKPENFGTFRDAYEIYDQLKRAGGHYGLSASLGKLFNNTFFGRDSAIESLMLAEQGFDPETSVKVLFALAELQGVRTRRRNEEEPGKIHHEMRDVSQWEAAWYERVGFALLSYVWGGNASIMRTYFAHDSTGWFLQLASRCVASEGRQLLQKGFIRYDGSAATMADAVEMAAEWIMSKQTDAGLIAVPRSNSLSLFFHTFQDSLTSFSHRSTGRLVNIRRPVAYLEVQAVCVDGLLAAAELLPEHPRSGVWKAAAASIASATVRYMWLDQERFFAAAVDQDKRGNWHVVRTIGINAGWVLDSHLLELLPAADRNIILEGIVKKLFSDEFLTNVGLRSRALSNRDKPVQTVTYHGHYTVWPSCTYMVARGLRRQGLYRLAGQLDNRVLNGLRLEGMYVEFIVVLRDGRVVLEPRSKKQATKFSYRLDIQMMPEHNIGLSAITSLAIGLLPEHSTHGAAVDVLERSVLQAIPHIDNELDHHALMLSTPKAEDIGFSTRRGRIKTMLYLFDQLK